MYILLTWDEYLYMDQLHLIIRQTKQFKIHAVSIPEMLKVDQAKTQNNVNSCGKERERYGIMLNKTISVTLNLVKMTFSARNYR